MPLAPFLQPNPPGGDNSGEGKGQTQGKSQGAAVEFDGI